MRGEIDRQGPLPVAIDPRFFRTDRSLLWVDGRIVDLTSGRSSRVDSVTVTGGLPSASIPTRDSAGGLCAAVVGHLQRSASRGNQRAEIKNREQTAEGKQVKAKLDAVNIAVADFTEAYEFERDPARRTEDSDQVTLFNYDMSRNQRLFERRSI